MKLDTRTAELASGTCGTCGAHLPPPEAYRFAYLGEPGAKVAHVITEHAPTALCGQVVPEAVTRLLGENGGRRRCRGCAVALGRRDLAVYTARVERANSDRRYWTNRWDLEVAQ